MKQQKFQQDVDAWVKDLNKRLATQEELLYRTIKIMHRQEEVLQHQEKLIDMLMKHNNKIEEYINNFVAPWMNKIVCQMNKK